MISCKSVAKVKDHLCEAFPSIIASYVNLSSWQNPSLLSMKSNGLKHNLEQCKTHLLESPTKSST